MSVPQLQLGQSVELELASGARVSAWMLQTAASHVWLELHVPTRVTIGDPVKVLGADQDGAVWCLDTEVVEVRDPGGYQVPLVKVVDNGQWVAVQRREYFRVRTTLVVALSVTQSSVPERVGGALIAVSTVDMSGGGLQLETSHALLVGDALDLALELPARTIHVSGVVTRVVIEPNSPLRTPGRDATRLVGVALGAMMERDRAELVRFVHDVERKLRASRTE
jgi:c-di-GMP-binding flagellar brake protein YcgR